VILPYHRMIELASENAPGRVKIGTTSRGIGPAYEDKMGRRGLRVADLLDLPLLKTHIENACREKEYDRATLYSIRSPSIRTRCIRSMRKPLASSPRSCATLRRY
jgi:adenylosuccinate synthase